MTRRRKIIAALVSLLILLCLVIFTFRDRIILYLVQPGPRDPILETPVTYSIGWWSEQGGLRIDKLDVHVIDSRLNLFNSKSLISYTIEGRIMGDKDWEPHLEKVHLSERFHPDSVRKLGIIEITPIFVSKENKNYNGEEVVFRTTNEMMVESFDWGTNRLLFKCAEKEVRLELMQRK